MLQETFCDLIVDKIGGADGYKVDLAGLFLCHLFVVKVDPGAVHAIEVRALHIQIINGGEAAAHQLSAGIKGDALTVHLTDQCLQVAADHAILNLFHVVILLSYK